MIAGTASMTRAALNRWRDDRLSSASPKRSTIGGNVEPAKRPNQPTPARSWNLRFTDSRARAVISGVMPVTIRDAAAEAAKRARMLAAVPRTPFATHANDERNDLLVSHVGTPFSGGVAEVDEDRYPDDACFHFGSLHHRRGSVHW